MKRELIVVRRTLLIACLMIMITPLWVQSATKPNIFYTDIIAGPNSGGENNHGAYITIRGNNFGEVKNGSTVTIGGGEVVEYKVWSDKKICVQLGPNVASGDIVVSTHNGSSAAPEPFTVRPGDFYFVSKTGDNNNGSKNDIAQPYRTVNHVMGLAEFDAGDFMVIRGGHYDISSGEEGVYNNRWLNLGFGNGSGRSGNAVSGTSWSNAITIYGYPGEAPVIDWGSLTDNTRGVRSVWDIKYYAIANLKFDLKDSGGVAVYLGFYTPVTNRCDYTRLVDLTVRGGMAGNTQGVNPISLQRVDYLRMYGIDIGEQSQNADPNLRSHVIYLSNAYTNADIGWCYLHDNRYGRGAFKVAGDGTQSVMNINVRIHDNVFRNLPQEAISFGIGARECSFYDNVIDNACTNTTMGFSPLSIRGVAENVGDYNIHHNTIYSDAPDSHPGGIIQIGFSPAGQRPHSVTFEHNIVFAKSPSTNYYQINHHAFDTTTQLNADGNIWFGSSDEMPSWAGPNSKSVDPLFVDAENGNFALREGSPAIEMNAGARFYLDGGDVAIPSVPENLTVQ